MNTFVEIIRSSLLVALLLSHSPMINSAFPVVVGEEGTG